MGFLDKVKDTANKAAEAVQQGAEAAQDKLEESKQKKKVGDLKTELGGIVYAQRTGTAAADAEAEIARLVGEIQAVEAELAEAAPAEPDPQA
jgi:type VI protein secretion system component VasF